MTIEWEEVSDVRGTFVKFAAVGDGVTGWVENYDPSNGATTFNDQPCGYIQVLDEDGQSWVVSLDNSLKTERAERLDPRRGDYVNIRFREERVAPKSGNTYKVISFGKAPKNQAPPMPERKVDWVEADEEPF